IGMSWDMAGSALLRANAHAMRCRYPHEDHTPIFREAANFRFRPLARGEAPRQPEAIWNACRCLDYQCCEDDEWPLTEAHEIMLRIMAKAGDLMADGLGDDTWRITD